jgi:hypothetical protein
MKKKIGHVPSVENKYLYFSSNFDKFDAFFFFEQNSSDSFKSRSLKLYRASVHI